VGNAGKEEGRRGDKDLTLTDKGRRRRKGIVKKCAEASPNENLMLLRRSMDLRSKCAKDTL